MWLFSIYLFSHFKFFIFNLLLVLSTPFLRAAAIIAAMLAFLAASMAFFLASLLILIQYKEHSLVKNLHHNSCSYHREWPRPPTRPNPCRTLPSCPALLLRRILRFRSCNLLPNPHLTRPRHHRPNRFF